MEFLNIQNLLDNQLNFSQFNIKSLCEEEREMLVEHLKSHIDKTDNNYNTMISSEEYLSDKYILLHIHSLDLLSKLCRNIDRWR